MKEIFDEYVCIADYCDKELKDGQPPCSECEYLMSVEDIKENKEN